MCEQPPLPREAWHFAHRVMALHHERDWEPGLPEPNTTPWLMATGWVAWEATKLIKDGGELPDPSHALPEARETFRTLLRMGQERCAALGLGDYCNLGEVGKAAEIMLQHAYRPAPGIPKIGSKAWQIAVEETTHQLALYAERGGYVSLPDEVNEDVVRGPQNRLRRIQEGLDR